MDKKCEESAQPVLNVQTLHTSYPSIMSRKIENIYNTPKSPLALGRNDIQNG